MGVHDDSLLNAKGVSQDDIGSLSPHPVESHQFAQSSGNLSTMLLYQGLTGGPDVFGLIPVQADPAHVLFEVLGAGVRVIGGASVFLEQIRRHDVDLLVRALSGKNGGNQQLERIPKVEFTMGFRIGRCQKNKNRLHALLQIHLGFPRHPRELRTSSARVKQKSPPPLHPTVQQA